MPGTFCLAASSPGGPCLRADAVPMFSLMVPLLMNCLHLEVTSTASVDHDCGGGGGDHERPDRDVLDREQACANRVGRTCACWWAGRERASVCCLAVHCAGRPNAKKPDVDDKEGAFV